MIETSSKVMIDKGVSVGRAMLALDKSNSSIGLFLINFSNSDQFINAGAALGHVESVELVGEFPDKEPSIPTAFYFDNVVNKKLSADNRRAVFRLLAKYSDCFVAYSTELGRTNMVQHQIETANHPFVNQPPYSSA